LKLQQKKNRLREGLLGLLYLVLLVVSTNFLRFTFQHCPTVSYFFITHHKNIHLCSICVSLRFYTKAVGSLRLNHFSRGSNDEPKNPKLSNTDTQKHRPKRKSWNIFHSVGVSFFNFKAVTLSNRTIEIIDI
jgi:hypothetical protein